MRSSRYRSVIVILLGLSALAFGVLRWMQGPVVEGYELQLMPLQQTVVAAGRVVTESRTQVSSEVAGVVLERLVREGDQVKPGDVLLRLRADDVVAQVRQAEAALVQLQTTLRPQANITLERAESQLEQARRETARRRALADRSELAIEALEQAEQLEQQALAAVQAARLTAAALAPGQVEEVLLQERLAVLQAQLAKTVIRAEAAGTVLTRNAEPGDLVQPGRVLFTIALEGSSEVRAPLDERNLALLSLQQQAMVVADAYPEQPFPARITFIAPGIDPQRGTVEVRLTVEPVPDFLRQDMTVSINIETGRRDRTLALPNDALEIIQGREARVLVVRDDKVFRQSVSLGLRGLAMTEIVSGLQAADQVLADPLLALEEGANVRFALRSLPSLTRAASDPSRNELPMSFD